MKKINTIRQELHSEPNGSSTILSNNELNQINGGLLLYCEEKRRTIGRRTYVTQQWKVAMDGSIWINIKM
jgi:bacteriocin-like protein